jgi:hypothetical protein
LRAKLLNRFKITGLYKPPAIFDEFAGVIKNNNRFIIYAVLQKQYLLNLINNNKIYHNIQLKHKGSFIKQKTLAVK